MIADTIGIHILILKLLLWSLNEVDHALHASIIRLLNSSNSRVSHRSRSRGGVGIGTGTGTLKWDKFKESLIFWKIIQAFDFAILLETTRDLITLSLTPGDATPTEGPTTWRQVVNLVGFGNTEVVSGYHAVYDSCRFSPIGVRLFLQVDLLRPCVGGMIRTVIAVGFLGQPE